MKFRIANSIVDVNVPDAEALLGAVEGRLKERQGFALATINLDHLVKLRSDRAFGAAYQQQDFVVADGNPIVWLSRLARQPVALVPGSDMVIPMSRAAQRTGRRVALVGSTPEALAGAADELRRRVPGVDIALQIAPPMGFDPDGEAALAMLQQLEENDIGLALLALGAPKQERLAARGRQVAPHVGFASIGAGLDFLAGRQTRAPRWVQKIAMEWAWRMLSQPGRLVPRYWACAKLLPGEAVKALAIRNQQRVEG